MEGSIRKMNQNESTIKLSILCLRNWFYIRSRADLVAYARTDSLTPLIYASRIILRPRYVLGGIQIQ